MQQYGQLLSLAIIVIAFYLIMIRPQQRRQKEHQALMESLQIGDRVMTIGGAYGTIESVEEGRVGIEVSPGVTIYFDRSAIARRLED
jgi:preprotein translocase subunit YajC